MSWTQLTIPYANATDVQASVTAAVEPGRSRGRERRSALSATSVPSMPWWWPRCTAAIGEPSESGATRRMMKMPSGRKNPRSAAIHGIEATSTTTAIAMRTRSSGSGPATSRPARCAAATVSASASATPSAGTTFTQRASRSSWSTTPGQPTKAHSAIAGAATTHARRGSASRATSTSRTPTTAIGKFASISTRDSPPTTPFPETW